MKTLLPVLLGFCITVFAFGQPPNEIGRPKRTPEEVEKLVAPIALYPDALIAIILPASTNASDVVLAARYLSSGAPAENVDAQPWDDSVKSLARYPEVVKWMDENLTWTRELGETFAAQPSDVMNTIQKLRSDARANGLLQDTPQQKVVVEDSEVSIVPAQDDVIYVPSYDPDVLILRRPMYEPWLTFSVGFATGSWLYYDCDWRSHNVWVYRRPNNWAYHPDWRWRDHDRERVVHETWRPSPTYWHHVEQSRNYGYHPVPRVEPPHFRGRENGVDPNRRWDGRRDERFTETQRATPTRPDQRDGTDHAWQQQRTIGVTPNYDGRIHNNTTNNWGSRAPQSATPPVVVSPSQTEAPRAAAAAPQPTPEHRRHTDGVAGDHSRPREINNPAPQRLDTPASVRLQPPAPPAPERIGQVGPREGQYPQRPIQNAPVYRREVPPATPAVTPSSPPVQHSAPPAPQPAARATAPAPAPAPAAAPRTVDPGRDQRGGYKNGNGDDQRDRR